MLLDQIMIETSNPPQEECRMKTLPESYETVCWGCGLRLLLPSYVPVFKCGWCGAITNQTPKQHGRRCFAGCNAVRDRLFVLIVLFVILSIICGGVWAVYPIVFSTISLSSAFHSISTFILATGTLVNFCLAAFQPAGPPPNILWGNYEVVGRGGLDDYSFCQYCAKPKSVRTHHCRTCGTCILDMDHHCPFIGNCVGAANHHHFISFLTFALLSNVYALSMSIYAGIWIWPTLVYVPTGPAVTFMSPNVIDVVKAFIHALMKSSVVLSARAIALIYLIVATLPVAIGLGLLLAQQIQLLYSGQTYLDSLKFRGDGIVEGLPFNKGWEKFHRIFGYGNPLFWLVPQRFRSSPLSRKSHEK